MPRFLKIYSSLLTEKTGKGLTDNRVLGLSEEDMVDPEVVSYPSFDGMEIEALFI